MGVPANKTVGFLFYVIDNINYYTKRNFNDIFYPLLHKNTIFGEKYLFPRISVVIVKFISKP